MTLDDITTQIERHYELTTNTTHSLQRLTQYFSAHSRVGQLKMKLADDNPIKDSLSLLGMQPQNTLAFFGSKDDGDRIIIYFQVEHFNSLVHILIHYIGDYVMPVKITSMGWELGIISLSL